MGILQGAYSGMAFLWAFRDYERPRKPQNQAPGKYPGTTNHFFPISANRQMPDVGIPSVFSNKTAAMVKYPKQLKYAF